MREATFRVRLAPYVQKSFNPRLPCGRRLCSLLYCKKQGIVSIHASHAGGDASAAGDVCRDGEFQSTPPMREATGMPASHVEKITFQSTPPMREATTVARGNTCRLGSFNPRLPCGRRLGDSPGSPGSIKVSIHASHAGGDYTSRRA